MKSWLIALYAVLLVLSVSDVITTKVLGSMGGIEISPFAFFTMYQFGFEVSALIKIGFVLLFGGLIWAVNRVAKPEEEKLATNILTIMTVALVIFYIFVVINNLYWIHIAVQG